MASGGDFYGKPRPAVILQNDNIGGTDSVTICTITSDTTDASSIRPVVAPSERNGLQFVSRLMADKITTVYRRRPGKKIGELGQADMEALERAILIFFGMAR